MCILRTRVIRTTAATGKHTMSWSSESWASKPRLVAAQDLLARSPQKVDFRLALFSSLRLPICEGIAPPVIEIWAMLVMAPCATWRLVHSTWQSRGRGAHAKKVAHIDEAFANSFRARPKGRPCGMGLKKEVLLDPGDLGVGACAVAEWGFAGSRYARYGLLRWLAYLESDRVRVRRLFGARGGASCHLLLKP